MKNVTDSFLSLGYWPFAGSFGFNTDILATNPINLSVVFGVLIFFGKGVCASCLNEWKDNLLSLSDLLDNRKQRILKTIQNSEELREGAVERLEKARARLRKVEMEAEQFRANGYSEIEREKLNLINSTYKTLEQLENYKNETIQFEQQKAINQVRQRVFQQALQGALGTLNSCLNDELHLRTISTNIGMFGTMKEIKG
uniref:ATP synthase subunit b, chloroplastic n=1 Tax=Spyridium parvifolium var. parvifolium TaxID=2559069 RepID=A0A482JZH9_9ROSA|nr:ATP synthase CF0 subunit I [Spyridium cordatum]YP_010402219.1 ATP synthase CF0 subunit I [Spyridium halmaturinum]YP_010402305.1 ATP synthase CF0 subunit I [Spyridium parvifolium]YP_010403897.1 ATP synthase CF0 subunit I [Spyridium coactilifolium]YP_010403983.1 ATP synthase CF0 subunit I [Spyridium coalitum]YP_010404069.1 ATP synthase CF0 subunit I [Spyridium daltonii]YP_010404155.1 ATP synthase CF0 subunit I [Spyridium daphnoides]YP_010404585.1 ATP synthase CF0 subunit I [Spyridium leucop